jgi:hypothetical protein
MDKGSSSSLIRIFDTPYPEIDYLANRIVLACSAVLLGSKPACTVTLQKQKYTDTIGIWNKHKNTIRENSRLSYFELKHTDKFIVILIYDRFRLKSCVCANDAASFLDSLGYRYYYSIDQKLDMLKSKFQQGIPHEIGIFLGLPLKDVLGFMGFNGLECTMSLGWKFYGNPAPSLELFTGYEDCRRKIIKMLIQKINSLDILRKYPLLL